MCREHQLTSQMLGTWKQQFLAGATQAFESDATHGADRAGEQKTSSLSYDKAKEILGWQPSVSFREGIAKTVAYFKQTA